jgi:hypothetical protein
MNRIFRLTFHAVGPKSEITMEMPLPKAKEQPKVVEFRKLEPQAEAPVAPVAQSVRASLPKAATNPVITSAGKTAEKSSGIAA